MSTFETEVLGLKPVRASLAASQFLIQLQYWKQQFQSPVACAVTGPKAGAQLACANLGRRAETSCLAETGPDYGAQIACASKHSAPSILMNGWEPTAGTTKRRQPPRVPQTLATQQTTC
jgi:hypothetical protein